MDTDGFRYSPVAPTREMLAQYGIKHMNNESGGDHNWIDRRRDLHAFAPRLLR